jgi:hypothetical protein
MVCYTQELVSDQIYGFAMPIELDNDTTYSFILDNNKCTQSLDRADENGGCEYMNTFPYLHFHHQISLNCCTDHFYQIQIKGDSIIISYSETGELCACGFCIYALSFSDQDPQKNEYHIKMAGKDTTVLKLSNIREYNSLDGLKIYYNPAEDRIYIRNAIFDNRPYKLTLFDISGRVVLSKLIHDKFYYIDTNSLQSGLYIVQTNNGSNYRCEKVILNK